MVGKLFVLVYNKCFEHGDDSWFQPQNRCRKVGCPEIMVGTSSKPCSASEKKNVLVISDSSPIKHGLLENL